MQNAVPFLFRNFYSFYNENYYILMEGNIMEKVINLGAIKANHAEMKEKRAEKKAERKAKKEAAKTEKKPVGKTLGIVGTYVAAAGAGAAAAAAVIKVLASNEAPIEIAEPEVPNVEVTVEPEVGEA